MILIWILVAYTLITVFIALCEIRYLAKQKSKEALILPQNDYYESIEIGIENQKLAIFSSIYVLAINACWLGFGLSMLKEAAIKQNTVFQNTIFLLVFLLIFMLTQLPVAYFKQMIQDKKHGFSNMSVALFIKDFIKSFLLAGVLGFFILYALLVCLKFLGEFWWLAAFVVSFVFIIIINVLYPTLIAPMFNKMSPLEDEGLLSSIKSLMDKAGFKMNGVFIMDASKRDSRLNAYFGGLFKTKRVVLFDTLLKAMKQNELLAVLAHELGHFVHKDLLKGLLSSACLLFVLFFILGHLPACLYDVLGLGGVDCAVFVVLLIFGNILGLIYTPIINKLSRNNEFEADAYAASQVGPKDMKDALCVLATQNKAFISHSKIESFFNHSHPSIIERINALDKH